jgi:hypothetical protein
MAGLRGHPDWRKRRPASLTDPGFLYALPPTPDGVVAGARSAAKHGLSNLRRVLFNSGQFLFVE